MPDPTDTNSSALEHRLIELERANRRLRITSSLALLTALAMPLLAFASPFRVEDEVRAKAFVLVDEAGAMRARLHLEGGATPSFEMTDVDGKRRIDLFVKGVEPSLLLLDADEQSRLGLAVDAGNLPHAVFFDEVRRPRLHLAVGQEGLGSVTCTSKHGTIDAGLGIDDKSGAWLLPRDATTPTKAPATTPRKAPEDPSPDTRKLPD